jgi:hypothetical protein
MTLEQERYFLRSNPKNKKRPADLDETLSPKRKQRTVASEKKTFLMSNQ